MLCSETIPAIYRGLPEQVKLQLDAGLHSPGHFSSLTFQRFSIVSIFSRPIAKLLGMPSCESSVAANGNMCMSHGKKGCREDWNSNTIHDYVAASIFVGLLPKLMICEKSVYLQTIMSLCPDGYIAAIAPFNAPLLQETRLVWSCLIQTWKISQGAARS